MYAFEYQRPTSRDAAKAAATGADTRYLAGGQSLIQAMRLRLSQSERLVDLGGIADLKGIKAENGGVTIGAMATHAAVGVERRRAEGAARRWPSSPAASATRWCATWARSAARSPTPTRRPATRRPCSRSARRSTPTGARSPADDFFTGLYETALQPGEMITAVSFPAAQKAAYVKFKQPASRFALVGVFVAQTAGGVRVAVTGAKGDACSAPRRSRARSRKSFTPAAAKAVKMPTDRHQQRPARLGRVPRGDDQRDRRRARSRRRWR